MKSITAFKTLALAAAAISASLGATAAVESAVAKDVQVLPSIAIRAGAEGNFPYGMMAALAWSDRNINVAVNQRWINVNQNEVVTFKAGDQEFAWRFSTDRLSFPFASIAPPEFANLGAHVYVGADRRYSGN